MKTLFDGNFEDNDKPKLPTLSAYLKGRDETNTPKRHLVTLVWLPNNYPSYGIETEQFRCSIHKDSPLGKALEIFCDTVDDYDNAVFLKVSVPEEGKRVLEFDLGSEVGIWKAIRPSSPLGLKFEMSAKQPNMNKAKRSSARA